MTRMFDSIDMAWLDLLNELFTVGASGAGESRDGDVSHELLGYSVRIDASQQMTFLCNPFRNLSASYAAAETLWYVSGSDHVGMPSTYAPSYAKFGDSVTGKSIGAYGPRIIPVLPLAIETLKTQPQSRRVVLPIWWDRHSTIMDDDKCKDLPCTLHWQFLVRNQKLHMLVSMRSNDAWLGFPYDVFAFTCFQRILAAELDVGVGTYYHSVGSMHLYARDLEKAKEAQHWRIWKKAPHQNGWQLDDTLSSVKDAVKAEQILRTRPCDPKRNDEDFGRAFACCGDMGQDLVRACNLRLKIGGLTAFTSKALEPR